MTQTVKSKLPTNRIFMMQECKIIVSKN